MISEENQPTQKKLKKTVLEPRSSSSFSSLPDEITENILARVSRWKYPWLSLVSRRFRALLSSMEIYKMRSQIGTNETCVYVCLQLPDHPYPSWFSLWPGRNKTRTKRRGHKFKFKQNYSGNLLVPIPSSPPITQYSTIAVGSEIYVIGGQHNALSTSSARILDCRSHTWRDAPNMNVARKYASVAYLDEKIYVMGGWPISNESVNLFKVFDIKTQSWTDLRIHDDEVRNDLRRCGILNVVKGKFYVIGDTRDYTYEPKKDTWEVAREQSSFDLVDLYDVWCVIENVMYSVCYDGYCRWYDSEDREWKVIKGLEELREHHKSGLKLGSVHKIVNYCGNLLVMWSPPYRTCAASGARLRKNKVWYAEISLETRCNGREVWGKVEWVDVVTVPREMYTFLHCLTVSV